MWRMYIHDKRLILVGVAHSNSKIVFSAKNKTFWWQYSGLILPTTPFVVLKKLI